MPTDHLSFASGELSVDDAYNLLVAAISPRPIALVSTVDEVGNANLAPFSFFMAGGVSPLSLAFSATDGSNGPKHTLTNILRTGEFVVNTVHREMAHGMNASSYGYQTSEWLASGFTQMESRDVKPFRVKESLVQMECRLFQAVRHGEGSGAANYVIGEVVRMHVHPSLWSDGAIALEEIKLLSRMGGPNYLDADGLDIFELERPAAPTVPEEG